MAAGSDPLSLLYPWMIHGNVNQYLRIHSQADRFPLVSHPFVRIQIESQLFIIMDQRCIGGSKILAFKFREHQHHAWEFGKGTILPTAETLLLILNRRIFRSRTTDWPVS
jgi:hypothetical protein